MLRSFISCFGRKAKEPKNNVLRAGSVESKYCDHDESQAEIDAAAQDFVSILIKANTDDLTDFKLRRDLHSAVSTLSWSENLASAILACLETALRNGVSLGKTVDLAVQKAVSAAVEFAKDHPVYFTLIALGVLVLLAPWVLEWLGFAEIGIIEGSWAALWQSRYAGYVPKRSLFAFFQRLGMILHWYLE